MKIDVSLARADEITAFYMQPLDYHMLKVDGQPAAVGGYVRGADGRLWAFLDTKPDVVRRGGMAVVRAIKTSLAGSAEAVHVQCNSLKYPTAERLLRVLGFEPTEEQIEERRVWVWQS